MTTESDDKLVMASNGPSIVDLAEEYSRCSPIQNGWDRLEGAEDVRFTRWAGQSADGKKWDENMPDGRQAFPWNGASDTRVPMADKIINEMVATEVVAFWRAVLRARGMEGQDVPNGVLATKILEWLIGTRQYKELVREVELHSQYTHTYGWSVLYTIWNQDWQLKKKKIKLAELYQMSEADGTAGVLLAMVQDGSADEALANYLAGLFPGMKPNRAKKAIKELRENGEADVPMKYLCADEPKISALKPWEQIIIPDDCADIQKARVVFVKEWLSEVELQSKIYAENWNKDWVDAVIAYKGDDSTSFSTSSASQGVRLFSNATTNAAGTSTIYYQPSENKLKQIVYAYTRRLDEDNIPGIYCTVFHPAITKSKFGEELFGHHELLDYAHGKMPFVARKRENWSRTITSSRGVPEIVNTWQREVKVQRDSLVDSTSFGTLPPIITPQLEGMDYRFGPAVKIPAVGGREPKFMDVPTRGTPVAFALLEYMEREVSDYFGRYQEKVPPVAAQTKQQMMVQSNLISWTEAFQQEFQLVRQYMQPERLQRIVGEEGLSLWSKENDEISGEYDFVLSFDVRELDTNYVLEKLKAIKDLVVPMDSAGRIDKGKLVEMLLRAIDPTFAKELITSEGHASQQLFRKVRNDIAQMFLGNEPEYVELDPTAGAQLQMAQQVIASNPKYQAAMQSDARFQELLQNYEKNLSQSVQQEQNKVTGRLGVNQLAA